MDVVSCKRENLFASVSSQYILHIIMQTLHKTGCSKSPGHILTLNILEPIKDTKTYKKT